MLTLAAFMFLGLHPLGIVALLALAGVAVVGINVTDPVSNFGAWTDRGMLQLMTLCGSLYNTYNVAGAATIASGYLTGALSVFLVSTNAAPTTQTTQTAAQLYADLCAAFGIGKISINFTYDLQITNTGAGTFTLAGGTGVTVTGTATIAQNTTRQFVVQVQGPTAITITSVGVGTYS